MAARWNSSHAPEKPRRRDKPQHLVSGRLPLQGFAGLSSACASRRSRSLPDSRAIASYSPRGHSRKLNSTRGPEGPQ